MSGFRDEAYFRMCGVHVHLLTMILAVVGIILNIAVSIGSYKTHTYQNYAVCVISIICFVLVILGNRLNSWILYWPFFIVNVLAIIGYIICGIILIIFAVSLNRGDSYYWIYDEEERKSARNTAYALGSICLILAVIQIIFMSIIRRDYIYVRMGGTPNHAPGACNTVVVVAAPPPICYQQPTIHAVNGCHGDNVSVSSCGSD